MAITDADERRHRADPADEHWIELSTFDAFDHASGVGLLSRLVVEPNRPGGGQALFIAWLGGAAAYVSTRKAGADGGDPDTLAVGAVATRVLQPQRRCSLRLDDGQHRAELEFAGFTPCVDYADGPAPLPSALAAGHFEQTGMIEGPVTLADRAIGFGGLAQRGRSWGSWHWGGVREWHRITGLFDTERSFNVLQVVDAHGGVGVSGYVFDRGAVHLVVRAERRSREASGGVPEGFALRLEVAGGNTFTFEAERWQEPVGLGDGAVSITETPLRIVADDRSGVGVYELVERGPEP